MSPPLARAGVLDVARLDGSDADVGAPPTMLIEVPHGADTQAHYDALFAQLAGPFPDHLEKFFQVNTDVGAWAIGRQTAEHVVARNPTASVLCIRCCIPRTFIDVNRVIDASEDLPLGMTPGLPPYVRDPADIHLLRELHGMYTEAVGHAYDWVCGAGGQALIPHTYAPRSVPIDRIDDAIVQRLEAVYAPDVIEQAPLRAEVDLITATPEGMELAPSGLPERFTEALRVLGLVAHRGGTYTLHPSTTGAGWSMQYPGQVLCFEVRRDLVTDWQPFVPKTLRRDAIDGIARALAGSLRG